MSTIWFTFEEVAEEPSAFIAPLAVPPPTTEDGQPILPIEGSFTDAESNFVDESPPGLFPENQDSNWGYRRKIYSDVIQTLYEQLKLIYAERFPQTSQEFLDEWEITVGLPPNPYTRTYVEEILADTPAIYLRFGELLGATAQDSSGNVHNGTYHNGFVLGETGALFEDISTSVHLDGVTNTNITVPDHVDLDLDDDFTIEAWVKLDGLPSGSSYIVDKGTNGYALRFPTAGDGTFALRKSGVADITASELPIPNDGAFHHVVATKIGSTVSLYLDNQLVTGTVTNATMIDTASVLTVGSLLSGSSAFKGWLQEFALYDYALSPSAVLRHYQSGQGAKRSALARRRNAVLNRLRKGPFTRPRRQAIVESYINVTFGQPLELVPGGIPLVPVGQPLYNELADIAFLYNIVEDIEDFSYDTRILASLAIDVDGLDRDLAHFTPAGLNFTVSLEGSSQGLTVPFVPPAVPARGLFF